MRVHHIARSTVGLVVVLLTGLLTTVPGHGAVPVQQVFTVPAGGTFTVKGHGYGHGRGMSQHGANGAALQGLTHQQILAFYYPGTAVATRTLSFDVLLTAHTAPDMVVLATTGLQVHDRGTLVTTTLPANGAAYWRIATRGTASVLQYRTRTSTTWVDYRLGGRATLVGDGGFRSTHGVVSLVVAGRVVHYRDWVVHVAPVRGGALHEVVNVVSGENYARGVVPAEMPTSWKPEAVQAQAVAARTYAAWSEATRGTRWYDICDTTACQVYRGYDAETTGGNAAVLATAGQVLTYGGTPAFTQFSASSGGWTAAGSAPYLTAHSDPYDGWSGNAHHSWSVRVSASTLAGHWGLGTLRQIVVTSRQGGTMEWGGRVESAQLVGTSRTVTVTGADLRTVLGLKSTWFWCYA